MFLYRENNIRRPMLALIVLISSVVLCMAAAGICSGYRLVTGHWYWNSASQVLFSQSESDGNGENSEGQTLAAVNKGDAAIGENGEMSKNAFESMFNFNAPVQKHDIFPDNVKDKDIYTVLVCGMDMDAVHADVVMLMSYNTKINKMNILQIPRDTYVKTNRKNKKLCEMHAFNGMSDMVLYVSRMTGAEVDYYVGFNTKAFKETVDLIGGVEVDVPRNMDYDDREQNLHIHLKKGLQVLDGSMAEQFVRFRKGNNGGGYLMGDIERIEVQRRFLTAFLKQTLSFKNAVKIPDMLKIFKETVDTDLSFSELMFFAAGGLDMDLSDIDIYTMPGEPINNYQGGSYFGIYRKEALELINQRFNPYAGQLIEYIDIMDLPRESGVIYTDYKGSSAAEYDPHGEMPVIVKGVSVALQEILS